VAGMTYDDRRLTAAWVLVEVGVVALVLRS
jgi:hypothetical protein